jgi:TrmH family RNA methyltransferase
MPDLTITSPANPRLKALVALRRRRTREDAGLTVVEGFEELALALAAGAVPRTLFICPELYSPAGYAGMQDIGRQIDFVEAARAAAAEIVYVGRAAFEKVSYRDGPDGLIGLLPPVDRTLAQVDVPADGLFLIAQGVEKPGNLGAMLRTADAAGVCAVIAVDAVTDWANPNVVRASKGTVFAVPVATATAAEMLAWANEYGIRLVTTTPETHVRYTDIDLTGRVAIVVGAEKHGISPSVLEAGLPARIPLCGKANSLNVAAAAAIVLFEAVRQRG